MPEVMWQSQAGNPGLLTVGQPGGKLSQPVPSQDPAGIWMWGLPSPGSRPEERCRWRHRPGTHMLAERTRGGLVAGTMFPWRRVQAVPAGPTSCLQVHLGQCGRPPPALPYLNISVTSPLASATRTGKPMQAGTRYRRAGYERIEAGDKMLYRVPAQGHAHHSNPLLGATEGQ